MIIPLFIMQPNYLPLFSILVLYLPPPESLDNPRIHLAAI